MGKENQDLDFENRVEQRTRRADDYHRRNDDQQSWYSRKASENKSYFRSIGMAVIVLGALVAVVPIFMTVVIDIEEGLSKSDLLVSIFGTLIVILKGIERIWLPEETWQNYRKASEALKRERECYVEGVGPYDQEFTEDQAYKLFVNRCILIKAEEQSNFWGLRESRKQENGEDSEKN